MFLLITSIFGITYYQLIHANQDITSISDLTVNRKQKTDYKNLFDNGNFKSITIEFSEIIFQELLSSMQDYFDQYGTYQDNSMHKITMKYSDGLGNSFTVNEVGFRTKSNTSRNLPLTYDWMERKNYHQTSFQLQFDATFDYDNHSNEYAVLNSREVFNVDQLNFEYCKSFDSQYDEAMISEAFAYYLYEQAGVTVSNASYGLVYFQIGEELIPFGFYTIIEPIDQEFIKKNFDGNLIGEYGDLYKATDVMEPATLDLNFDGLIGIDENEDNVRFTYSLKNNSLDGTRKIFNDLTNFIEGINNFSYYENHFTSLLDVDMFIRTLAMGFLIGNTDDYRYNYNNFYLYFDVYTNQVSFIPFDLDSSLGFGKHQDLSGNYGVYYDLYSATDETAILINNLLAIPVYNQLYLQYLEEFIQDVFRYDIFYLEFLDAKELYESILVSENHLGNQVFHERNASWYFTTKAEYSLNLIENYHSS